jgi:hypothetical protein
MKPASIIFIIISGLVTSCYKVYDPHIDTAEKVLVVNGMITNKTDIYHVLITYAKSFNSVGTGLSISAANVYVTDDLGNSSIFHERGIGNYISDSLQFTGHPGRTYWLHIVTPDGEEYKSDPQQLFPAITPDSVFAQFDNEITLSRITGLKVNTHGANILMNIRNKVDTLPRLRITSNLVTQYYYSDSFTGYYCWKTDIANLNINLTGGEYYQVAASIKKHIVCFLDDNLYCYAVLYTSRYSEEDSSFRADPLPGYSSFMIYNRIVYLNIYSLNKETYLYYKSLDEQMQSEGKLFDPIAVQLNGNIKCISDPEKKAIGFFEASSVSNSAYIVDFRNLKNSQPSIIKTPYILPPESDGCRINNTPSFWIF